MSSSHHATCILKGCDAKFINGLVVRSHKGEDIRQDVVIKSLSIVNSYDLKECNKVVLTHGDFHDAYVRLQSIPGMKIESSSKLKFYRQFAFIYVRQIINMKVKVKIDAHKLKKKMASEKTAISCSICLENIEKDAQFTKCDHTFHRACMTQWGKNICPLCRGAI
jgi:hypothetical protein